MKRKVVPFPKVNFSESYLRYLSEKIDEMEKKTGKPQTDKKSPKKN